LKNQTLIAQLKNKSFTSKDGFVLLYTPSIVGCVLADNGDITELSSIVKHLRDCVGSKLLIEAANHCFERFHSFHSSELKELYALFGVNTSKGLVHISKAEISNIKRQLVAIEPLL